MIVRKTLTVQNPAEVWSVSLPEKASKGRILGVWGSDGNSLPHDSDGFKDGSLSINFGFDKHSGLMDYEFEDGNKTPIEVSESLSGMTLNITNTNTCGCGEHAHTP